MGRMIREFRVKKQIQIVSNKAEITQKLRKAMEFYQELGFERLPIKEANLEELLADIFSVRNQNGNAVIDKQSTLKNLQKEIGDCQRCRLSEGRKNIVFGEGNPDTKLMLIGEGPGREEDLRARPFVGEAGKVLTNLIKKMGLEREDVYIANIVKCRPPSNRDPEDDEIATCSPFLEKQMDIIGPEVIIALGKIAAQTLVGSKIPISKLRGRFYSYKDIPVMPTFHPAYLMRNPKDKWLTWEDAQKVLKRLRG